jgi:RpiR family transcriptional regulator, repressor of rpiB and als operon
LQSAVPERTVANDPGRGSPEGVTMPFDPRTVGPRIRMLLPDLTSTETRITEILLRSDNGSESEGGGEEPEVSEAMVVKTAKRLGFTGYKELRAALQAYKSQPYVDLHQEVALDDTVGTIVHEVFRTSIQALEETLAILDMGACGHAAEMLHGARQRDFYGLGDRPRSRATSLRSFFASAFGRAFKTMHI